MKIAILRRLIVLAAVGTFVSAASGCSACRQSAVSEGSASASPGNPATRPADAPPSTGGPAVQSGNGSANPQAAASTPAPPDAPLPPAPVQGALEAGKSYAVGASGRNTNVELTVSDLQIAGDAGGAAPGTQLIVLTTAWKNLVAPRQVQRPKNTGRTGITGGEMETVTVETPYLVQTVADNLYLLIDGRYVAEIADATASLPDALPSSGLLLPRYNAQVQGKVAFVIPPGAVQSVTLQFFDFTQGHITLPIYGKTPAERERPIAGPQRNQLFDVALFRTQFVKKAGTSEAPAGEQYLLVECSGASTAAGAATQIDLSQYAFLVQDGVYQSAPLANLPGVPHLFHGLIRFIPGYPRRGVIAFLVPEQPSRLELLFAASQMDPLRFVLTPDRQAAAQPSPRATIRDGDNIDVLINSWTWVDRLGDATPPDGGRYLVLDVTMANREAHSGLTVQKEQFSILSGATTIEVSGASERLRHSLLTERTVSASTRARFQVAYEVPQPGSDLRLRYQGFTKVEEVAIR